MDLEKLEAFIDLAQKRGATFLEYKTDKEKYSVSFGVEHPERMIEVPPREYAQAGRGQASEQASNLRPIPATSDSQSSTAASKSVEKASVDGNFVTITSPFVGTFYKAPSPESDPYVKVGDQFNVGQVLCIVEAMKIMNEIESEISGEIVEICVDNETYVEYGQTLFKVKPA